MQTSLLDFQPSIDAATKAAKPQWRQEALATIEILIKRKADFTSEDVLDILDEKCVTTKDNRALGGLIQLYARKGLIRFICYRKAERKTRHGAPIAVWRPIARLVDV